MKRKYYISTRDGKIAVKGYPVVIPGYEQFSFFVHRHQWGTGWVISEVITGLMISPRSYPRGMGNSSRAGALAIVMERFKSMGVEYILPRLQNGIKGAQDEAAKVRTRKAIDGVTV